MHSIVLIRVVESYVVTCDGQSIISILLMNKANFKNHFKLTFAINENLSNESFAVLNLRKQTERDLTVGPVVRIFLNNAF